MHQAGNVFTGVCLFVCLFVSRIRQQLVNRSSRTSVAKEEPMKSRWLSWSRNCATNFYHCVHNVRIYLIIFTLHHRMHWPKFWHSSTSPRYHTVRWFTKSALTEKSRFYDDFIVLSVIVFYMYSFYCFSVFSLFFSIIFIFFSFNFF